jgi:hypothetical protein
VCDKKCLFGDDPSSSPSISNTRTNKLKGDIAAQCFEASKADEINEFSPANKKGIKKDQGKRGKILKFKLSKTYIEF